jgi:Mg-chelatase subunit ChlD
MAARTISNRRKTSAIVLAAFALLACLPASAEYDPEKDARNKPCNNCGKPYEGGIETSSFEAATSAGALQGGTGTSGLSGGTGISGLRGGTGSTALQTGTSSTTLQTGTASTMLQTGTQSTMLQTGTQSTLLQGGTGGTLIKANVEREAGPVNILFIVDCSYSMKEGMGGGDQKMDAAKRVMQNALARIPNDVNIGLRVFGQGFSSNPAFDCQQSTLLVPMAQGNRRSIIERIRQVHPFGLTPLTFALRQAAQDFQRIQGQKTVILITDGAETCGGQPCEFVRKLTSIGVKMKVDIVGLALKRDHDARRQLNCIAEASGGKYYDADTAAQLVDSVSRSVDTAISGRVLPRSAPGQAPADPGPPPNPTPADTQILKNLIGR